MPCCVTLHHHSTERGEALRRRVRGRVGAAHRVAEIEQHLCDAAHAGAANADEVNLFDLVLHAAHSAHASATRAVASGLASSRALAAMASSSARVIPLMSAASSSGVRSFCSTNTAAPASERNLAFTV